MGAVQAMLTARVMPGQDSKRCSMHGGVIMQAYASEALLHHVAQKQQNWAD